MTPTTRTSVRLLIDSALSSPELTPLRGYLLAALVLLCACTPTALPPPEANAALAPANLSPWTARGRLAWITEAGTETANFTWTRESPERESVTLSGPVGLGATRITRNGAAVTWLDDGEARSLESLSLSSDAAAALSALPFARLGGWLLGNLDTNGAWQGEVLDWTGVDGWRLPRTLRFQHGASSLRLAVLEWDLPARDTP